MKRKSINGQQQLTRRESAFVENVAGGENQTKAVVKAGYSKKSAKVIASQLIDKAFIREAIRQRKNEAFRAKDICAEMLVGALSEIAFTPIDPIFREDGAVDLGEARRLGLMHLIKKVKVVQTPFGDKTEVEFYSRLEAIKKLIDIKEIRLPSDQEENSRYRASFDNTIQDFHAREEGKTPEEVRYDILAYYKENMPEHFDRLIRAGVEFVERESEMSPEEQSES